MPLPPLPLRGDSSPAVSQEGAIVVTWRALTAILLFLAGATAILFPVMIWAELYRGLPTQLIVLVTPVLLGSLVFAPIIKVRYPNRPILGRILFGLLGASGIIWGASVTTLIAHLIIPLSPHTRLPIPPVNKAAGIINWP